MIAALVAGCGSSTSTTTTTTTTADETEAVEDTQAADEGTEAEASDLKAAIIMSGAANDLGWNQTAYEGFVAACEKYGITDYTYSENVATADIAATFADYANNGYDIVVGHGFEFGDPALEIADQYPDTTFIITEADAEADNVGSFVMACEQTAYVEGVIAANMSESGVIGAIGPVAGSSLIKIVNGFEDGAKSVNPDIQVLSAWTNDYVDTQIAMEDAVAMIEQGADVIKHCANASGTGAINAAVENNIWCMGDSYDQSDLAPENMLDSALYNLDVVLDIAIGQVVDNTFVGGVYNLGMADGAVAMSLTDNLPEDVKAIAEETIQGIMDGTIEVVRDEELRQ